MNCCMFEKKRVIVYGTGINANLFIDANRNISCIICCIDKNMLNGSCNGIPIKTWEDIEPGMADCLVIAASPKHVREIYYRVLYDCDRNNLDIYDWRGTDLRRAYGYEYVLPSLNEAFTSHYKERLLHQIDIHDVISFDLFDTLVVRKTFEYTDVFELVDYELKRRGIEIPDFSNRRLQAEKELPKDFAPALREYIPSCYMEMRRT